MFSATTQTTKIYTEQETAFIASLEQLLVFYRTRSKLTFITGDIVINGTDRTVLKKRVVKDLISAIKDGCENIRFALNDSTLKHGLNPEDFLAGKTAEFLNNSVLFELLSTPHFSVPTCTKNSYEGAVISLGSPAPGQS